MRWFAVTIALLLCGPAMAADWSINNRIKPGENRSYVFTTSDDSSMLDARACATTRFAWQQDIVGTQTTAEGTLYSCPEIDSDQSECSIMNDVSDDVPVMSVNNKPGFFFFAVNVPPTGSAESRINAYCMDEYVAKPDYVRSWHLIEGSFTPQSLIIPISFGQYPRGYLSFETSNGTGAEILLFNLRANESTTWILCQHPTGISDAADYVMLLGGQPYEATTGTAPEILAGVDLVCAVPMPRDLELLLTIFNGISVDIDVWFYGIPD